MKCTTCGFEMPNDSKFCGGCGRQASESANPAKAAATKTDALLTVPVKLVPPPYSELGKLIAQGMPLGKTGITWSICILGAIGGITMFSAIASHIAEDYIQSGNIAFSPSGTLRMVGLIIAVAFIVYAIRTQRKAIKTSITVYQLGIVGIGLREKETRRTSYFRLTYDQVTSIKLTGEFGRQQISVSTPDMQYLVMVANPEEILQEANNAMTLFV